jgi:tetratricopeptide (TPR) repeat protein
MNILDIQVHLDKLYESQKLDDAHQFLLAQTQQAINEENDEKLLFLLNELLGYYRAIGSFHQGNMIAEQLLRILISRNLDQTINGATSYLNIATLDRAQGKYQEALSLYQKTEMIYKELLAENDEKCAGLFNNESLLYQEMGNYQKAIDKSLQALNIISHLEDCRIEEAINCTNLSLMYFSLQQMDKGKKYLDRGIALFEKYNPQDSHYFAALSSLAQYYYFYKDYQKAIQLYDQALLGIEKVFGKNKDYEIVLSNKQEVEKEFNQPLRGLDICQKYYEKYGKKMIDESFFDYKQYMAIGLFGFGSDCLGYDDDISQDHDFGPGFCIWLPREIYQEIGQSLQAAYLQLPDEFMGYRRIESAHGQGRVGVFIIEEFFKQFLYQIPMTLEQWLYVDENALLACTNGRIFDDYLGVITSIRKSLSYFPEDVRLKKIVRAIAKMAQSGQYNYARCMRRGQEVAASLALHEFIDETLSFIYLMNKKYKPYYKWSYYGLKDCVYLRDISSWIKQLVQLPSQREMWKVDSPMINTQDQKIVIIEKICQRVIVELQKSGLITRDDDFLDVHTQEIMERIQDEVIRSKHIMEG